MLFRTELTLPASSFKIHHRHRIVLLGSCFSQNVGARLQIYKFNCFLNPFGTIFHPLPIARLMNYIYSDKKIESDTLLSSQGRYVHPDFHSSLSSPDPEKTAQHINQAISDMHIILPMIDYVFITLGTSTGYIHLNSGEVVANCHKIPAASFTKTHSEVDTMVDNLQQACNQWLQVNPNIKFIFTVSPVRHIKDGIVENMLSKAKLLLTIEKLSHLLPNVSYFPAYEWMMDDLRDYRYYEKDLIHPNELAIDYIWEKFSEHYFDKKTQELNLQIEEINRALNHRSSNPDSETHRQFLNHIKKEIAVLQSQYPWLTF